MKLVVKSLLKIRHTLNVSLHYLVKKKQVAAERLTTFSQSVIVSVGMSKLGVTDLIFVDPGAKVNSTYYRDVLLSQQLLPMMRTQAAFGVPLARHRPDRH